MVRDIAALEKLSIPAVGIFTSAFIQLAKGQAIGAGMPDMRFAVVPHPVDGLPANVVQAKAQGIVDDIIKALTCPPKDDQRISADTAVGMEVTVRIRGADPWDALEKMNRLFLHRGWSSGFPLVPPTREKVDWMLRGTDCARNEVIGVMRPKGGQATVEKIAVNAVMAGCLPSYMPILITAVEAMTDPAFDMAQVAATAGTSAPLLIINGPIRNQLRVNYGTGALGTAWRANATIGAAVRLILANIGGALPGITDMSVIAWPGDFSLCMGENEEANPWQPIHVEKGFDRQVNTVTAVAIYGMLDLMATTDRAEDVLGHYATVITGSGSSHSIFQGTLLLLSPEPAALIASEGFSKQDVKEYLFNHVKLPFGKARVLATGGNGGKNAVGEQIKAGKALSDELEINLLPCPDDVNIVVVGGASMHTAWAQPGHGRLVTKAVTLPTNWDEIVQSDREAIDLSMPAWLRDSAPPAGQL